MAIEWRCTMWRYLEFANFCDCISGMGGIWYQTASGDGKIQYMIEYTTVTVFDDSTMVIFDKMNRNMVI